MHAPAAPLADFVERFWYYEGFFPEHTKERLIPDGAIELIIDLGATPKRLFDSQDYSKFTAFRRSWISGQQSRHLVIDASQDSSMIGVRFRPGGAYRFLEFPACELNDRVVEVEQIWGSFIHEIRDRILEAPAPAAKFRILEEMLRRRACGPLHRDPAVRFAVNEIMRRPEVTVRTLASEAGVSQSRLVALFKTQVGQKPKTLLRVFRLQSVIRKIENGSIPWSYIANECGYFDQAHFIKDFQALAGLNPSEFLASRDGETSLVLVQ